MTNFEIFNEIENNNYNCGLQINNNSFGKLLRN